MDIVGRVAERFKADLGAQLNATPLHRPGDWAASGGEINLTDLARAAIAEVFDWLAAESCFATFVDTRYELQRRAEWLAARRKEALGE